MTTAAATRPRSADFDHEAAFVYFAADVTRSQRDVAATFNVSEHTVSRVARAENWRERRADLHRRAAEKTALRSLEQRNRDTLRAVDKARLHLLSDQADDPKWSDLPGLVKLEQLIEGEATSRLEVAHVREFLRGVAVGTDELLARLISEHMANGKGRVLLADFRSGFAALLEQRAGELPSGEAQPA